MRRRSFTRTYGIKSRILPTPRQITFLQKNFGCARKIYNLLVEKGNKRDAEAVTWHEQDPEGRADKTYPHTWTTEKEFKEEYPYLKEADSHALQYARKHYHEARDKHYSQGAGKPKFKSKWHYPRTYTPPNEKYKGPGTGTVRVTRRGNKDWLRVPKLPKSQVHDISEKTGEKLPRTHQEENEIRILLSRPITDNMRIIKTTLGQNADVSYYASLCIEETITTNDPEEQEEHDYQLLASLCFGGDLGLKHYLTGTNGTCYDDPADYTTLEEKYKKEQRKLGKQRDRLKRQGKCLSECRNYQKQKRRVARLAKRIADKRRDYRHKLSRHLADSYSVIALENLGVKGMMKNHHLARAVQESSWSDFVRMVRYKADWAGKKVLIVDRFFPSTSTCSHCGAKTGPHGLEGLGVREWVCPECGAHHERDVNAAWNVLLEALRVAAAGDDEDSEFWVLLLSAVIERFESVCEPNGRLAPAPTDGTSGVAWVEGVGCSSGSASYPCVYTEPPVVTVVSQDGAGLGEHGVSKKSLSTPEKGAAFASPLMVLTV